MLDESEVTNKKLAIRKNINIPNVDDVPLMMTPLLVGRLEDRCWWTSRKTHCLPTKF